MRVRLLAAFAAVYLVWGSTYLAIRFAVETLPPLLMAGTRFLIAGSILLLWARFRERATPVRTDWRTGAVSGALLLLGGNGAVVWAERLVPSGTAALLVAGGAGGGGGVGGVGAGGGGARPPGVGRPPPRPPGGG